jgi:acetylornithine deacetylase
MTDRMPTVIAETEFNRDGAIHFLASLIGLQADGEEAVQQAVAQTLAAAGGRVEMLRYEPLEVPMVNEFAADANVARGERLSVVATFPGKGGGRSVILFAHPDGEPIADIPAWQHDRFAGVVDGGRLYGWGVADDLAGVAIAVSAMTAIKAAGIELAGDVIIASTPSKRHARGVAAVLDHGYTADAAIYLHPAESGVGMHEIKAFASGQLEFSITVAGRLADTTEPGHTAFAHRAVNPLDKALLLIAALKSLDARRGQRVRHPLLDAAVGRSTNILISSVQFGGTRAFSRLPIQLTVSSAVTFPPSESIASVQAEIEAALAEAVAADDWLVGHSPVINWLSGTAAVEVDQSHPLYQVVAGAIGEIAGIVPHVNPMHTASDIRNPWVQKQIPTVGFGPLCGDLTQTGRHDEWVDVEDHMRAVNVAVASIIEWCGKA